MGTHSRKVSAASVVALIISSGCIFSQISRESIGKSPATEDARAQKRTKIQEANEKRQREEQEKKSRLALSKQLIDARVEFDKARTNRKDAPAQYINSIASLASAYQSSHDSINANKYYNQAIQLLESKLPESEYSRVNITSLWNLLSTVPEAEFQSRFEELVRITEIMFPAQSENLVLNGIRDRQYHSHLDRDAQVADRRKLLEIAIRVCSSSYGSNDSRLAPLVREYSHELEASENLAEAEKQMRRSFSLAKPQTDEVRASQEIELAQFYLRHQMREKMQDSFNKALALCHGHITQSVAYNFSFLTSAYNTSSYGGNPEEMILTLLANGGDEILAKLDPQIDTLVNNYISSGSISRAEKVIRKRVEASEKCKNDPNANVWRLRLSDTLLALGQDNESNRLFEDVRNATVLAGGSVEHIMSNRKDLLERLGKAGKTEPGN